MSAYNGGWVRLSWWGKQPKRFTVGRFTMGILLWEADVMKEALFDCSMFRVELASSER